MDYEGDLRKRLAKICRHLHSEGLTSGSSGNVSARIPDSSLCLIKPSGYILQELVPNQFLLLDIQTRSLVNCEGKPSIETPLHTHIYRIRKDISSIVHVHAYYTTVLSIVKEPIQPYITDILEVPDLVRGIGYSEFGMPGTEKLANNLGIALKKCDVAVMPHHGLTSVGSTPEEATNKAVVTERLAKIQYYAMLLRKPLNMPDKMRNIFYKQEK